MVCGALAGPAMTRGYRLGCRAILLYHSMCLWWFWVRSWDCQYPRRRVYIHITDSSDSFGQGAHTALCSSISSISLYADEH